MTGKRRNEPLFLMVPPDERARLVEFSKKIDRPMSWVVRDALRVYLDAVERDAETIMALRSPPSMNIDQAGQTRQPRPGRPRKPR